MKSMLPLRYSDTNSSLKSFRYNMKPVSDGHNMQSYRHEIHVTVTIFRDKLEQTTYSCNYKSINRPLTFWTLGIAILLYFELF